MHMFSKKDLNSAELETLTTSKSHTTVITANGEVQTHEEAIVYVRELDTFLTMKLLEDTPAVLSLPTGEMALFIKQFLVKLGHVQKLVELMKGQFFLLQ